MASGTAAGLAASVSASPARAGGAGISGAAPAVFSQGGCSSRARAGRPVRDFIEFGALPGAVPCARLRTRLLMQEWRLADLIDSAELVVSELVTNAVKAAAGLPDPVVRLWITPDPAGQEVLVQVWDGNGCLPVSRQSGLDEEGGRGLLLVAAVSADWGAWTCAQGGKVIWAVIAASDTDMQRTA